MDEAKVFRPTRSKYLVFTADYILPSLISLTLLSLGYLTLYSPLFRISNITCLLDFEPCSDPNILAELAKLKGQNIFTFQSSVVTTRLTSGDFTIRAAHLSKSLPASLHFELESVYPVAALQIEGDPTWVVLDSKLRVIGTRPSDPNVPTVMIKGPLTVVVGRVVSDEQVVAALTLAQKLADEIFTVKTITLVDQDTIDLTLPSGKHAVFTPKKDELAQLRALQGVLADATITRGVKTIDVRFSQPVLR